MTPEAKVKVKIREILDIYYKRIYYYMPVPGGYGSPTLDYLGAFYGLAFAIEAKAPGKKPTVRQAGTIETMQAAGVVVFVIDGEPGLSTLRQWLQRIEELT